MNSFGIACLTVSLVLFGTAEVARASQAEACAKIGTDDTVRPYDPALRQGFVHAFEILFPGAKEQPSDELLKAQGSYRCMNGRLLACFTGANLPCVKIDAKRENPGASTYCHDNPNADFIPMVVTGHDTAFAYACKAGRAVVTKQLFKIDQQGFGVPFWAPMN